jgi:hypothetical protein
MRTFLKVGFLLFAMLAGVLAIETAPNSNGPVAVISNPWGQRSAIAIIAIADGFVVRASPWTWLAVGSAKDGHSFLSKLDAAGAVLVISPIARGIASG